MEASHRAEQGGICGGRGRPLDVALEILCVPDCPNLAPMLQRLQRVTDCPVTIREITTLAEAVANGMAGSPTLLVDGMDPFANGGGQEYGVVPHLPG